MNFGCYGHGPLNFNGSMIRHGIQFQHKCYKRSKACV